jgi:hypothetical protein
MVLKEIEQRLINKESLDLQKLKQIEKEFPREQKPKIKGSLFDGENYSSSSSSN